MTAIAALFGYWHQSIVAGTFMMAFLLFLEKIVRLLMVSIADVANAAREGRKGPKESDLVLEALEEDKSPGSADRLNDYLIDNWKKERGQ